MSKPNNNKPILEIEDLRVRFHTRDGIVHAVNDVSYNLFPGESLGIVGESGSGKSISALSVLGLVPQPPGVVTAKKMLFNGQDLTKLKEKELRKIRGNQIAMIFQDPMTCLNPVLTVGKQIGEVLQLHRGLKGAALTAECIRLLEIVGISAAETRLNAYPHQLSGGMRQRVMIAMGISCNPAVLLADEPTTALDVTIQDQILKLMKSLAADLGMAMVFITHNFGAVAGCTDRIIVMYAGEIVEAASSVEIFHNPQHPYTQALLKSIPNVADDEEQRLFAIPGNLPNPSNLPEGCKFAPRCQHIGDQCPSYVPLLQESNSEHYTACWRRN